MKKKRKGEKWPFIRWAEKEQAWKVDARTKDGGQRQVFEPRTKPTGWAEQQRIKRKNEGDSAFELSAATRIDAASRNGVDCPLWYLAAGMRRFYVRHAATATGDKTIQQVVDELLTVKKSAGMSARYLKGSSNSVERVRPNIRFRKSAT